jgi:hypothetical protein
MTTTTQRFTLDEYLTYSENKDKSYGLYEETIFRGSDRLISQVFPTLEITAEQVLLAGELL